MDQVFALERNPALAKQSATRSKVTPQNARMSLRIEFRANDIVVFGELWYIVHVGVLQLPARIGFCSQIAS